MRRSLPSCALVVVVVLGLAACQDTSVPSQPENLTSPPGASGAFVDASTTGSPGFRWQPPIVKKALGENNRDLAPWVVICPEDEVRIETFCNDGPTERPDEDALATLEAEVTPPEEEEDRYEAAFRPDGEPSLEVGDVVRVFAFPGDPLPGEEPSGWFDVELTDPDTKTKGNKKLKMTDSDGDGILELQLGSTLPVAFRMGDAHFCTQANVDDGYCFVGTFSNDEGGSGASDNRFIAIDVDPDFIPEAKVQAGVEEVTFVLEREERGDAAGEGCLDGTDDFPLEERDLCVRGATEPDMMEMPFKADQNGDSRVTLGMCFDGSGLTQDEEDQFQGWDADEIDTGDGPVTVRTPLRGQAAPSQLDCSGFSVAMLDAGPVRRLAHASWTSLRDVFVPPAHAINTGAGHSIITFSRVVYARSLVLDDLSPSLEGEPGEVVTATVQVRRPAFGGGTNHFDSEAEGSDFESDYPEDTDLFLDDLGPGPLDDALDAADVGVNGVVLGVEVTEGSVDGDATPTETTVTTGTVDGADGVAEIDVTLPEGPSGETVTVTVTGPALGSPVEIEIDLLQGPVIENLAPSTTLASDFDYVFNGTGDFDQLSILFDATDPDDNLASIVVEAAPSGGGTPFPLLDESPATTGSKVVDPNLGGGELDPADGEYTTTITLTDEDGLQATASIDYTLDTTAPLIFSLADDAPVSSGDASVTVTVTGDITDANGVSSAVVQLLPDDPDGDCIGTPNDFEGVSDSRDVTAEVQADGEFSESFTLSNPGGGSAEVTYCVQVVAEDVAQTNGAGGPLKSGVNTNPQRTGFTIVWNPIG